MCSSDLELTKTKAELDHLRLSPAKPKTEVALKPAAPAPQGDRRQALEEQIAGLEKKIVEAGRQSPGAETEEIRKWKSELAVARASLYNLVMEAQRRAPKPAQAPVAEPQPVPLAESPRRKTSLAALAALTLAAVAVFGLVVWLYQKWSEPVPSPAVTTTPVKPAIEPKVIVDPVVPPKPDASEYRDAQGRFTCWLPTAWNVAEQTAAADESRLRLVNGKDAITVVVSGTDWPALVKTDQPQVEAAFAQRLKIAYPDGLFGQLVGTTLQMMDGEPAMLMEYTITLRDSISVVKALEYRKAGRAHLIELHANSREQATLLAGVFDKFLSRYHSGTDASN